MHDASRGHGDSCAPRSNWKRDELVARILRRWRELTGGGLIADKDRRTLVACSAGADSVALAFSIAQIPGSCVLAHVRHDIRPSSQTDAEASHVADLSQRWGVPFVHGHIEVRDKPHNLEANARMARYQLLDRLAEENDCPFIATGHHADDQLETLLISLMRGSGLSGMAGMRPKCPIPKGGRHLLRPMLDVRREEIEDLLRRVGLTWHEDPTNADTGFTRNRIRHELLPVLRAFQPDFAVRASNWAQDLQATHHYLHTQVDRVIERGKRQGQCIEWERADLREEHGIILGLLPHRYVEVALARAGLDTLTRSAINDWAKSLKSRTTDRTVHRIGPIVCYLDAHHVRFEPSRAGEGEKGH